MSERLLREWIRATLLNESKEEVTDDKVYVKLARKVFRGGTNAKLADLNEIVCAASLTKQSDIISLADLKKYSAADAKERLNLRVNELRSEGIDKGKITNEEFKLIIQNEINLGNAMAARIREDAKSKGRIVTSGFWTGAAGAKSGSEYGTEDVIAYADGVSLKYSLKRNKQAAATKGNPGLKDYNACLPPQGTTGDSCSIDMNAKRMKQIADELYSGWDFWSDDPDNPGAVIPSSFKSPNRLRDAFAGELSSSHHKEQEYITDTLVHAAKEIATQLNNATSSGDISRASAAKSFVENAIEGDVDVDVVIPDQVFSSSDPNNIVSKLARAKEAGGNYSFKHDGSVGIIVDAIVDGKKSRLFRVRLKYADANHGWGIKAAISESSIIAGKLLKEELTKSDKKEIEKLARKETEKQIKQKVSKMIQDELKKEFKGKELEKTVTDLTKKVLQSWHDLVYRQKHIIDRIKI
tara:strand:+ start:3816 stop:5216 length:1401 start_codon:yes stop_codon:yes gene_type:complete